MKNKTYNKFEVNILSGDDSIIKSQYEYSNSELNAPGLVGKIAIYINEVSYKYQPVLSLAAAIILTGTLYGHRIKSRTGLRTNVYAFALANTGSGKDDGRKAIRWLIESMGGDFSKLDSGAPASDVGILSALEKSAGVSMFLIDEIGNYLSGINGKNAPSHLRGVMSLFTELFTSAQTVYRGREYSNRSKDSKPRVDISYPCACVLGSSVPNVVFDAVTSEDIRNGFLPRWLMLKGYRERRDNQNKKDFSESSGVKLAQEIPNLLSSIPISIIGNPHTVVPNEDASKILDAFKDIAERMIDNCIDNNSDMQYIWTRAAEIAEKLALIGCEYKNNKFIITKHSAKWACDVVIHSIINIEQIIKEIEKTPTKRKLDEMYNKVRFWCLKHKTTGISGAEFAKLCDNIPRKERDELRSILVETERFEIKYNDKTKGYQLFPDYPMWDKEDTKIKD